MNMCLVIAMFAFKKAEKDRLNKHEQTLRQRLSGVLSEASGPCSMHNKDAKFVMNNHEHT